MEFAGKGTPLTAGGFEQASQALGGNACALWALITVETSGFGFLADRRPKMLFEQHWFHQLTRGRFDETDPGLSSPKPGYPRGVDPYTRMARAMELDRMAALDSASWGLGQIMGFNAARLGYRDAADMIDRFRQGEDTQLDGVRRFIAKEPALERAFRSRDWATVGLHYNGPAYARNEYDAKLAWYFGKYTRDGTPAIEVRAAQAWLAYLGFNPGAVDGLFGIRTRRAMVAFQKASAIPVTLELDSTTLERLEAAASFGA
jgi:hypothetical protein